MKKDKKRVRSTGNAVVLRILAEKYNVSEHYARQCSKGFSGSDKGADILADYKILLEKLSELGKEFIKSKPESEE